MTTVRPGSLRARPPARRGPRRAARTARTSATTSAARAGRIRAGRSSSALGGVRQPGQSRRPRSGVQPPGGARAARPVPARNGPSEAQAWPVDLGRRRRVDQPAAGLEPPDGVGVVPVRDRQLAGERQPQGVDVDIRGTEISATSSGRSSSPTENFTNGSSSFQRSSLRYDLRKMSLMGGAKWAQQISASDGSRINVIRSRARRRPSRTRSHDVTPSRSARSMGARPSSASHASTSAAAHGRRPGGDGHGGQSTRDRRNSPGARRPSRVREPVPRLLRGAACHPRRWLVGVRPTGVRRAMHAACGPPCPPDRIVRAV